MTRGTSAIMLHKCHKRYMCCDCCRSNAPPSSWPLSQNYALRGISFRLRPNELLGLLGPNGAGKTTAMKLVVGDERTSAGEVTMIYYVAVVGRSLVSW